MALSYSIYTRRFVNLSGTYPLVISLCQETLHMCLQICLLDCLLMVPPPKKLSDGIANVSCSEMNDFPANQGLQCTFPSYSTIVSSLKNVN